jgi:predicted nucleic acid-binding protein
MRDLQLQTFYEAFFKAQTILVMPPIVFDEAARLRADFTGIKTPDALHLATAVYYDCDEFWTNDNRLDKVKPNLVKSVLTT